MKFAVCVTFQIKEDSREEFHSLIVSNARTSLALETGCVQFDVCTDEARPGEVFLYEIYASAEAFDEHLQSEHFLAFDAAASAMIANKQVRTFRMVQ